MKIFIAGVLLLVLSSNCLSEKIATIDFLGEEFYYPPPEGFCNVTSDMQGIVLKQFLDEGHLRDPSIPKPQIILRPCDSTHTYPWGWVGLQKNMGIQQGTLNKFMAGYLKQNDFDELLDKGGEINSDVMEEIFEISSKSMVKKRPKIIWADGDSLMQMMVAETNLDGTKLVEEILTSTTVTDDFYVFTYIYNVVDTGIKTNSLGETNQQCRGH